ncbi:unannotated protein [freshwater metagenome]|uniref:Unannotated protein n=1 Tax=freshwater metagenome TaxID=449393 RepID=A0A6J7FDS4_9ZZZZ|nr:hypothetical protein [Actinomycetota bacterium]MSZ41525.1 hypothetical protein [Actinomycetota bacterium]
MANTLADDKSRFRCAHCGNLTRFTVVRSSRVQEFWHLDMAGVPVIEEREVLSEEVEKIQCRWCNASDAVELVARPEFGGPASEGPGDGGV